MFKKFTAVLAAALLGLGLSIVAVAAPASAHDAFVTPSCNAVDYRFESFGADTTNTFTVYLDGATTPVVDITFANSYPQTKFSFDGTTSHTVRYVVKAQHAGHDQDVTVVTSPCAYPTKAMAVTCDAVVLDWGSALTNGIHFDVKLADGTKVFGQLDLNVGGGYEGLGLKINGKDANGNPWPAIPLTEQQVKSGHFEFQYPKYLLNKSTWSVRWVQVNDMHFNQDEQGPYLNCNFTGVTVQTEPSFTEASCSAAGKLVVPAQSGIIWSGGTNGAGQGTYTLVAKAADGFTLTGTTSWTITVPPMKSGVECAPPCLPNTAVTYTYEKSTNSGNIHVENIDGSTGKLCKPFWVTATSWKFIEGTKEWSQVRDVVQVLPKIDAPGDYPYVAPVKCGQGDIYASFIESPQPPKYLHGPSNPWAEHFLHEMGFKGPDGPTYTVDSPGCNIVVPAIPTAKPIEQCGQYGSVVVPADSAAFTYTTKGDPTQGKFVVTATVKEGYVVQEGAQTVFPFDLGTYHPCVELCTTKTAPILATNVDAAGWSFAESGKTGHVAYVDGGLHIFTEGNTPSDKAAGYIPLAIPLGKISDPSITYASSTGGQPGLQIVLDADGDGVPEGTIVQELNVYGAKWWSKMDLGVGAGAGYPSFGTLQQYLDANPAAKVVAIGFSLGSGVKGDAVITSLSFGCNTYLFDAVVVDPKVTVEVGACYPNGDFSSKNAYFVFDNLLSDVPVTFSVPTAADVHDTSDAGTPDNAGIVVTVAAHTKSLPIETTPYWHKSPVGYDVFAGGKPLEHVDFPAFAQCQTKLIPGDPNATPQICKDGQLTSGGIWVAQLPDKISYSITGGTLTEPLTVTAADGYVELPPGDYLVTAAGLNGFEIADQKTWPYKITVEKSIRCDTVEVPAVPRTDIACNVAGSYTLPTADGIQWSINGVKKDPFTYKVFFAADVSITATITAPGVFFPNGQTSSTWVEHFAAPAVNCDPPTLATLHPTASQNNGSCTVDPTYTLSNTTSEHGGVQWMFGDPQVKTTPGTHKAGWGSTVVVEATLVDPIHDGFETYPAVWTFKFPAKPACGDLVTLALTGSSVAFIPWLAGGLLMLGGAGIYFSRRLSIARKQ